MRPAVGGGATAIGASAIGATAIGAAARAAALILVAAWALGATPAASSTGARASGPPAAGAAPFGLLAFNAIAVPGKSVAERAANYRRLYDAGVRAIRLDINWTQVQPIGSPRDRFDFSERDREVQAIRQAGLKAIGILGYGHPDYSARGKFISQTPLGGGIPPFSVANAQYFPPDDPADFARYARATAAHYGPDVLAWEVWNEQNAGWRFWPPHEDPAAYARLLCATYPQVKQSVPNATVLYGGVFFPAAAGLPGTSGPDFLQQTYDANPALRGCFDAVAYHPYPYPFTAPELDVPVRGSVLAAADQMRAVLERNHDASKPLWITEVGWPTHDRSYGVSEEKQAQYVARMAAATFAQGVPVLTYYTYGDSADPTGANQEAWFGFFRPDNSPKPSYQALRTFSSVLAGTHFVADLSRGLGLPPGQLNTGRRGFALEYATAGRRIRVLWLANESAAEGQGQLPPGGTGTPARLPVRLPVSGDSVTVVDYLGARRTLATRGGTVALELGPGPQYVIDAAGGPGANCASACPGAGVVVLPSRRRCASRRAFRIHLRRLRGVTVTRVAIFFNGRHVRTLRPGRRSTRIDLRGLPRGAVSVRVVAHVVAQGQVRRIVDKRLYHPCRHRVRHHKR